MGDEADAVDREKLAHAAQQYEFYQNSKIRRGGPTGEEFARISFEDWCAVFSRGETYRDIVRILNVRKATASTVYNLFFKNLFPREAARRELSPREKVESTQLPQPVTSYIKEKALQNGCSVRLSIRQNEIIVNSHRCRVIYKRSRQCGVSLYVQWLRDVEFVIMIWELEKVSRTFIVPSRLILAMMNSQDVQISLTFPRGDVFRRQANSRPNRVDLREYENRWDLFKQKGEEK